MDETKINAQFAALIEQRNLFANQAVNFLGENAVLKAQIEAQESQITDLTNQLEAAKALVADNATVVENPDA